MAKTTDQKAFLSVDISKLEKSAEIMRALAHPLRMKIMGFIDKNKNVHVNKIYNTLGLEQSITSQHLRILRNADLVKTKREGKFIFYSLNYDKIAKVLSMMEKYDV
ncbi:MAG: helix-turn-helix transcriptional regulator [Chitinophagales bacterium]|nr:helix-turn-helix transcriptional regulator [Chitinophagales bacterium]HAE13707.1 transcriptional regulator [Bacteroidota bacterium]MCB9022916.1 helix-turn-helix transcriptional regulator [Chitinophagales bacterium]HAE35130.1 transcriptional regulator [Bacteroidota bacterium]HPE97303.1 metalloregulator ArsR/SmtB family transcription factor [Chitinophagales bacterium]